MKGSRGCPSFLIRLYEKVPHITKLVDQGSKTETMVGVVPISKLKGPIAVGVTTALGHLLVTVTTKDSVAVNVAMVPTA